MSLARWKSVQGQFVVMDCGTMAIFIILTSNTLSPTQRANGKMEWLMVRESRRTRMVE